MGNIKTYIKLSERAKKINQLFDNPNSFVSNYLELGQLEQKSYINYVIVNNSPYIFREIPLLYEQIVQYLADELGLGFADVKLIGSAKTGFSISPKPSFGNPFTENSDLDFTVINDALFENLRTEFELWAEMYTNQMLSPKDIEKPYWDDNLTIVRKNIERGFIDTYKIPNRDPFPLTRKINDSLFLITYKLNEFHGIKNKKSSLRVYKDGVTFLNQLKLNTESVLRYL
ncbi:MAG: hypothetical protein P4L34_11785 [Paludibacter sp.]|nr:hypothetical protein [Paludibacter sp.]